MKAQMDDQLTGNPFRGLADMAYNSIQMQWGWAVLLLGAGLVTYAGWKFRQAEKVRKEKLSSSD
jgi:hypothetical protein